MPTKEHVLMEIIDTYLHENAIINVLLNGQADTLDTALEEIHKIGPVNYKRYENNRLLISYLNEAEQIYVSKYVKENKPVKLEEVDETPFSSDKKEKTVELIQQAYINGAEVHINVAPKLHEEDAYDFVKKFGEPKHQVDEDGLPFYTIINYELHLQVECFYGEEAVMRHNQHLSKLLYNKQNKKLEFDSTSEMYINPIKNINLKYYLKPYGIATFILALLLLTLIFERHPFAFLIMLSILTFPYVDLWLKSTKLYNRFFHSGSIIDHIKYLINMRKVIDQNTGDDVRKHTHTTIGRYGRGFSETTVQRNRYTANDKKFNFSYAYIIKNTILKIVLYAIVGVFSFGLYIIAAPQLNKKGMLNRLAR